TGRRRAESWLTAPVVFFFSSRRRHTRLVSDWSSDVCSSDLGIARKTPLAPAYATILAQASKRISRGAPSRPGVISTRAPIQTRRSEERRVGKEGGGGGGP